VKAKRRKKNLNGFHFESHHAGRFRDLAIIDAIPQPFTPSSPDGLTLHSRRHKRVHCNYVATKRKKPLSKSAERPMFIGWDVLESNQ
jgi:hypothetical protein